MLVTMLVLLLNLITVHPHHILRLMNWKMPVHRAHAVISKLLEKLPGSLGNMMMMMMMMMMMIMIMLSRISYDVSAGIELIETFNHCLKIDWLPD